MRRGRRNLMMLAFVVCVVMAPRLLLADADDEAPLNLHQLWRTWGLDPGTLIGLAISALLYGLGLIRTWRASGIGHGIRRWEAWCFLGGWLTLVIALVSPLHPLGEVLFSAHMVQHELLMLVAAPLLVLSRPVIAALRALPAPVAGALARFSNTSSWKGVWGAISNPFAAWSIHAVVLWVWHAPILFQATLHNDWIHALQHICFLLASLLFWWAVIHGHRGVTNYGGSVLYLFTTAIHTGLLGLLLTFSRTPWYPDYDQTAAWGLSSLEDQQLGGLIMWVPACTIYILAGLFLFAKWLQQSEEGAHRFERSSRPHLLAEAQRPVATPERGLP